MSSASSSAGGGSASSVKEYVLRSYATGKTHAETRFDERCHINFQSKSLVLETENKEDKWKEPDAEECTDPRKKRYEKKKIADNYILTDKSQEKCIYEGTESARGDETKSKYYVLIPQTDMNGDTTEFRVVPVTKTVAFTKKTFHRTLAMEDVEEEYENKEKARMSRWAMMSKKWGQSKNENDEGEGDRKPLGGSLVAKSKAKAKIEDVESYNPFSAPKAVPRRGFGKKRVEEAAGGGAGTAGTRVEFNGDEGCDFEQGFSDDDGNLNIDNNADAFGESSDEEEGQVGRAGHSPLPRVNRADRLSTPPTAHSDS
jgi:hypothetical protein